MAIAVPLGGSDGVLLNITNPEHSRRIKGITVNETNNAAACVSIRETDASGKVLIVVRLLANTSQTIWFDGKGLICNGDVWEENVTGAYSGSLYYE